jgi:hypothetical protein
MPPKKKIQYIRNTRYVPVSIRLNKERRIELAPRGQRGDCAPVNGEEMESQAFLDNDELLFEVVSSDDAKESIGKQVKNQQSVHPALSAMRNAKGEEYTRGVIVEESDQDQGKVVAGVNERGMITRLKVAGTEDNPLPDIPDSVPPEEHSDWLARQKNVEGPKAGLGDLKVVKDPPQKAS